MITLLNGLSTVKHHNGICLHNGRQTVGNHHQRRVLAYSGQRVLYGALGTGVNIGGRLIKDQHLRGFHQHAGQRQQLLLPNRQIVTLLAQMRIDTVAHASRQFRQLHRFQYLPDLRLTDVAPQRDVREERVSQHDGILLHHGDALSQHLMTQALKRATAKADFTGIRRVVAHQQAGERTLAAAGVPHQRHKASRRNRQRNVLQHQLVVAIGKGDIINVDIPALQRCKIVPVLLTRAIHQFKDALASHHRLLQHRLLGCQFNQRLVKAAQIANKRIQHPNFNGSLRAKAKQHQQATEHQRGEQAQ